MPTTTDTDQLRPLLDELLGPQPPAPAISRFADLCHRMASAYLGKKAKGGHLNPSFFGLSIEDLAFDCIAPLFERGPQGRLTQLTGYFPERRRLPEEAPEALLAQTRRLVFSCVEQELFDHYGQMDPGLSKLIRNLKRAAKDHERFSLERPDGELWLVLTADQQKPLMPVELLERRLTADLSQNITAPELLEAAARLLTDQPLYRPALPVTQLAQAARSGLGKLKDEQTESHSRYRADQLQPEEIEQMIQASVQATSQQKRASYVGKGKVEAATYQNYFKAIEDVLADRYLEPGSAQTFYEHLRRHQPMNKATYQNQHRTRLEYLVQLTREQLFEVARPQL